MNTSRLRFRVAGLSVVSLVLLSVILVYVFQNKVSTSESKLPHKSTRYAFPQLPMCFEKNMGQASSGEAFLFRNQAFMLSLYPDKAIMALRQSTGSDRAFQKPMSSSVTMSLVNANQHAKSVGLNEVVTRSNYLTGNDPSRWLLAIPNYEKVQFTAIYPGIDMVYYGHNGELEYDFNIAPGVNPGLIALRFGKETDVKLDGNGDLVFQVGYGSITLQAPIAYQEINGVRKLVQASYSPHDNLTYGFEVGEYDPSVHLVIDPVLDYSTYMTYDATDIAVDNDGYIYITGDAGDAYVTKLEPDGSAALYTTYLGGDLADFGLGIAVDNEGYIYVTGETQSDNYPTVNAVQEDFGGMLWVDGDAFVTKLNPDGSTFVYSTYLGGEIEDTGRDIAVDNSGNAYVTGVTLSSDFPVANAMFSNNSGIYDAFVTKINADGSAFVFSTYLGGSNNEEGNGIAVDNDQNIYITGQTFSEDFPTVNAYQEAELTGFDAFVTKINAQGTSLVFSTYLTGVGNDPGLSHVDKGTAIAVDGSGNVYIAGTTSSQDFPVKNAVQPDYGGGSQDGFVTKFTADGSTLEFSTYLGGGNYEDNLNIALDSEGNVFVTGSTQSTDFPTEQPFQSFLKGSGDAFVTGISSDGLAILFSTFLGGSGFDNGKGIAIKQGGDLYVSGYTGSQDFPTVSPLFISGGGFISKIELGQDEEMFVVQVLEDSLNHDPEPIAFTKMDIYHVDISKPNDPFIYFETQSTNKDGLLHLPASAFEPGRPFLVRTKAYSKPAVKTGHEFVNDKKYDVYVDNLHIDNTGKIHAAYLVTNINDTTRTFMEHSWVGLNLVVSIEWPASDDYVNSLKSAYSNASKYMYDVTNGQARLQKIALYDDKSNWENSDVKVRAKNTEWPRSHVAFGVVDGIVVDELEKYVYLPPIFFGSVAKDINNIFNDPLNPDTYMNYEVFVHELGHYVFGFFDEYKSKDGTRVYPNKEGTQPRINFGFMDGSSDRQDPMNSEMSAFESPEYEVTAQFQERDSTCWEYFRGKFRSTGGAVRAEFHSPKLLRLSAGEIVEGPLNGELGVGSVLEIVDKTGPAGNGRLEYLVKDSDGEPKPGASVRISKPGNTFIWEGKTVLSGANRGKIKLFTAQPGDRLFFSLTENPSNYMYLETVAEPQGTRKSKNSTQGSANEVILKRVQGNFRLLSEVKFTASGSLEYNTFSNLNFSTLPTLQIFQDENTTEEFSMASFAGGYTIDVPDSAGRGGALAKFKALDSAGTSFFILQDLNVLELNKNSYHLVPSENSLEMWLDPESQNLTALAILGSNYPAPVTGLPDSMLLASPVFAFNQQPVNEGLFAQVRFLYDADTLIASNPDAVTIYHWKDGWQAMPTSVNTEHSYASTRIEEPGFYAAFLDLTQTFVLSNEDRDAIHTGVPKGFALHQNYPNPFNPVTTIPYSLPRNSFVQLRVYNLMGQEVAKLVDGIKPAGEYEVKFNAGHLPSGVYLYQLQVEGFVQTMKMIY